MLKSSRLEGSSQLQGTHSSGSGVKEALQYQKNPNSCSCRPGLLSLTPSFSWVVRRSGVKQTASAVSPWLGGKRILRKPLKRLRGIHAHLRTPLKQGVNERAAGIPPHSKLAFAVALLVVFNAAMALAGPVNSCAIIPQPEKVQFGDGIFRIRPDTRVILEAAPQQLGGYLADRLAVSTGYQLKITSNPGVHEPDNAIV
jgi:hypothetical protein